MTSTLQRTSVAGQLDGRHSSEGNMNGSLACTEDGTSVGSDSVSGDINLNVVLPDGTTQYITVDARKQMMDLLVKVTASNKLSPSKHVLRVYNEETGQHLDFKPSNFIGSLGVSTIYLVHKEDKQHKKKNIFQQSTSDGTLPFVKTQRLTVNLPKGQRHLLRIDPKATLGQIYQKICEEKRLDPYRYELRHPTIPDEPLNMARPLEEYQLVEITVVSVTTPDSPPHGDYRTPPPYFESNLRPASSVTSINSTTSDASAMSRRKDEDGYMPRSGAREKKKKGIFSFFSRKKQSGTFTPASSIAEAPSSSKPPSHPTSSRQPAPAQQHAVAASSIPPAQHTQTLPPTHHTSHTVHPVHSSQSNHGATNPPQVVQSQSLPRHPSSRLAAPVATNRKKRQAPPPPGAPVTTPVEKPVTEPVMVAVSQPVIELVVNDTKEVHSRQSSRSSGFEDTPGSPVESPGASSEVHQQTDPLLSKTNLDATSISITEVTSEQHVDKTETETLPRVREVSDHHDHLSDISSIADSAQGSLPRPSKPTRGKKKMAPAPPPTTGASNISVSTSQENISEQVTLTTSTVVATPPTIRSPNVVEAEPDIITPDEQIDIPVANGRINVRVTSEAVAATNQVLVDSITGTPRTARVEGTTVADSSTDQLNDTEDDETRIEMSTFVEQMQELTEKANTEINLNKPTTSHVTHGVPDNTEHTEMKMIIDSNRNIDSSNFVEGYKIKNNGHGDTFKADSLGIGAPDNVGLDNVYVEPAIADMDNSVTLIKKETNSEYVDKEYCRNKEQRSGPISVTTSHGLHKQSNIPLESPADSGHSSGDIAGDDEIMFDMDEVVYEEPATRTSFVKTAEIKPRVIQDQAKPVYLPAQSRQLEIETVKMDTIYEQEMAAEPDTAGSSDKSDFEEVIVETETVTVHPDGRVTVTTITETKPPGTPLLQDEIPFMQELPNKVDRELSPPPIPPPMSPVKEQTPPVTSLRAAYRKGRPKVNHNGVNTDLRYDLIHDPLPIPMFQTKSEESTVGTTDEEVPTEVESDSPGIHRKKKKVPTATLR